MPLDKLPMIYPQLVLTIGIVCILLLGLRRKRPDLTKRWIMVTGLVFLIFGAGVSLAITSFGTISDLFRFDSFTRFFILFSMIGTGIALILASQSLEITSRDFPEFSVLLLTICIGVSLMAAAQDLLLVYLAIETVSLSSYILTGFKRNHPLSHEASLKYVIFGGVASGVMVFGMSLLYGLTGTTSLSGIAQVLNNLETIYGVNQVSLFALAIAFIMVLAGFCFKIAAVPFHMWCPDVYQGAPTPFTAFLSVIPKAAGFAVILRFVSTLFPYANFNIKGSILAILGIISALTMTLGNFSAIHQTNVKRLLAYSSIAHAGYLLMGVVVLDAAGSSAVLLYLIIYLIMNLGAFVVVQTIADASGSEDLTAYRGLGSRNPFIAFCFAIFLFSLAGLPPLAGFIGKFFLFAAIIKTGGFWYLVLAVIGILNSVIALFYYVKIIREMFLTSAEQTVALNINKVNTGIIAVLMIPIFVFGLYWEPIQRIARTAAQALGLI